MPLASFDIVGFSLQYELTYSNILTMLRLAGIPFKSSERQGKGFPIIIAGGGCTLNPEPLADFIDLFLIGDGEEAVCDIVDSYKKSRNMASDKDQVLRDMAGIEGVYIPSLYKITDTPAAVKKRILKTLKADYFPTKPVVPYISAIHDRITLEIMRGCPNNCYFCQAKSCYSPVRLRARQDILRLAQQAYDNTGLDEISLVSLSTSDYPEIESLIKDLTEIFKPLGIGLSLPSLHIEEKLHILPLLISAIKKSTLTFAPEAGTERMLHIINKDIKYEQLFNALRQAYRSGWQRVKLYFMIGVPEERDEDVGAVVEIADKAALLRKEVLPASRAAEITISVSSFVPKPHTIFERASMASKQELERKREILIEKVKTKSYLKLKIHDINTSILEAIFSRGDRKLGGVLLDAWENGARFDAWGESFKPKIWEEAFYRQKIDKESYIRGCSSHESLPWQHIQCK
jgi:radical SAM family uncharacterized protein